MSILVTAARLVTLCFFATLVACGGGDEKAAAPTNPSTFLVSANNGTTGSELFLTDGTAAGTTLLKDINTISSADPQNLVVVDGANYFTANDGRTGRELWKSDGTTAGTIQAVDLNPGVANGVFHILD